MQKILVLVGMALSCGLIETQQAIAQVPDKRIPAPAPAEAFRYWTTRWSFEDINIATVLGRLRRFGVDVPIDTDGDVSLNFIVSVPINALGNGKAYRFSGALSSDALRLEQLQLANFSTDVRYESGILRLENLKSRWIDLQQESQGNLRDGGGRLNGNASLAIVPRGDLDAAITAERVAIAPLHDLILAASDRSEAPVLKGEVAGSVSLRVPLSDIRELASWNLDADFRVNDWRIDDTTPLTLRSGPLTLRDGHIEARSFVIGSPVDSDIRLAASLSADLIGERQFNADVRGNDVPLSSIAKLVAMGDAPAVTGKLDIDATGNGRLGDQGIENAVWDFQGRIASPQLSVFGLSLGLIQHQFKFDSDRLSIAKLPGIDEADVGTDRVVVDRLSANYQLDREALQLTDLDAAAFGGALQGSARIARTELDSHQIKLRWQDLQPRLNTSFFLPAGIPVSLRTSGEVDWVAPVDSLDRPATHLGLANIELEQLIIGSESVGNLQLSLGVSENEFGLTGAGNLFGGQFRVETETGLTAASTWWDLIPIPSFADTGVVDDPITRSVSPAFVTEQIAFRNDDVESVGTAFFNQINLARITRTLPIQDRQLAGVLSGRVDFGTTAVSTSDLPIDARARLTFDNLALDRQLVARRINADLGVSRGFITFRSLRGSYAGGQIEAVGRIAVSTGRGRFQLRLSGIDASRGLMLFSPDAEDWAGGILSGRLTIETGPTIRARGAISVRDSKVFAIPIGTAHASLNATADRNLSRWNIGLHSVESSVGQGQLLGSATLRSSTIRPGAFDLTSDWTARRLDFGRLLQEVDRGGGSYARGNLDGRLVLNGTGVRSASDLTGRFSAELDGSQARAIPGLISLATKRYWMPSLPQAV